MNLIKATIATAAITVCCLGNDYPAKADLSRKELHSFHAGQNYGYALGLVASGCIYYGEGLISRTTLRSTVKIASELDDTTPAIRKHVLKPVIENSEGKYKACVPVVRSVMGTTSTTPANRNPYQSADNWY